MTYDQKSGHGKRWPKLTELQLAVLAAIRDNDVRGFFDHKRSQYVYGGRCTLVGWDAHGFNVTGQIKSLRKRQLIRMIGRDARGIQVYDLNHTGVAELTRHPEF